MSLTGIDLSKKVAELYGIDAIACDYGLTPKWLHEDSARCFELTKARELNCAWYEDALIVSCFIENKRHMAHSITMEVGDSKMVALRTAILQCLVKMKETS